MDDPKKGRLKDMGFENWLTNVFWVYYKWYFFVGLALFTILVCTLVSYASKERSDLVLTYVYAGTPDEAQAETARALFAAKAVPEKGRRSVKVKVEAVPLVNEKGERALYGELADPDRIIYVMDDESISMFEALGYFGANQGVVPGTDLFMGVRNTPIIPYLLEDFADQGYTQEQVDESNAYREEQHQKDVQAARDLVAAVRAG